MENWLDVAHENRKAAAELFVRQRFRSAVSRAYFAAFACANHFFHACSVTMKAGREGAGHSDIPKLIESKLTYLDRAKRQALSQIVTRLYTMRLSADYHPSHAIDETQSRVALSLMRKALDLF